MCPRENSEFSVLGVVQNGKLGFGKLGVGKPPSLIDVPQRKLGVEKLIL